MASTQFEAAGLKGAERVVPSRFGVAREARRRVEAPHLQLARELHDRAGWHLSALNYGLFAVESDPADREAVAELRRRFEELAAALREITTDVRRGACKRSDLVGELSDLCSDWTRVTRIPVVLQSRRARVPLTPTIAGTIVAVVREALTNVSKHARGASRVELSISGGAGEPLRVTLADDGSGLDPALSAEAGRPRHHGLTGMRERLSLVGGRLAIRTGPAGGVELVFEIDLAGAP